MPCWDGMHIHVGIVNNGLGITQKLLSIDG